MLIALTFLLEILPSARGQDKNQLMFWMFWSKLPVPTAPRRCNHRQVKTDQRFLLVRLFTHYTHALSHGKPLSLSLWSVSWLLNTSLSLSCHPLISVLFKYWTDIHKWRRQHQKIEMFLLMFNSFSSFQNSSDTSHQILTVAIYVQTALLKDSVL